MSDKAVAHGPVSCMLLAAAALSLAPISISWIVALKLQSALAKIVATVLGTRHLRSRARDDDGGVTPASNGSISRIKGRAKTGTRPTALVNGGRMQKAVYIVRALAKRGYRVILVEEYGWGEVCAARFSNAVDRFYLVTESGTRAYTDKIVEIARAEGVVLFVPCSGVNSTVQDAEVAEILRQGSEGANKVTTLIQNPDLAATLHEKDRFIELVHQLELDAPTSHIVSTPNEAIQLLRKHTDESSPMIMKSATVVDDVGRNDMTTYPLRDPVTFQPDWEATQKRLTSGLNVPLQNSSPYIAQEFISGKGASEWCTHATVHDGRIVAFVCCPSNDMLMTYHNATHTFIGALARQWTETFLTRLKAHKDWKNTRLTGQFSMDFIHQPSKDRLVVIECNPRVHTAVCLLDGKPETQEAFGAALAGEVRISAITPGLDAMPVSWAGHDVVARRVPFWLPRPLARWLYGTSVIDAPPSASTLSAYDSASSESLLIYDLEERGRDGAWSAEDPAVYAALYHLQWPHLLFRQAVVRKRPFSRINVSTARVFEC